MILALMLILTVGLQPPPDNGRGFDDGAQGKRASKQNQPPTLVSARAVSDFFQWARERKWHEFADVSKKAVEVFPPASAIEGYPVSVGDPTSRRSLSARFIGWKQQLEGGGVKVEDLEAVTLFFGGDGQHNRDVVLVVSKDQRRVIGVYQIRYGR
jgi:hypothetical protein